MDEWEASETNNLHQRFSSLPHLGEKSWNRCYSFPTQQPLWGVAYTDCGIAATVLNLLYSLYFLLVFFWKSTQLPNPFCPRLLQLATGGSFPSHLTTALAGGSSAGSSSFQRLEKTLEKEAKLLPFWRSLWEPLHVGCSCWYSRESGKIVVNPPGHGGCFMPAPTGCWWGQPRAGRDTCSTGIVPFFGLATGGKGGEQ